MINEINNTKKRSNNNNNLDSFDFICIHVCFRNSSRTSETSHHRIYRSTRAIIDNLKV